MIDRTSMLFWFPKLYDSDLGIPLPFTRIVKLKNCNESLMGVCDGDFSLIKDAVEEVEFIAEELGYPLFLRTDYTSNKHDWVKSCFIQKKEDIKRGVMNIIEFSFMADIFGLPINALVLRDYIPMKTLFKAFSGMPVNPEIRFFIKDGKIDAWYWYWVEDAIANSWDKDKLPSNWRDIISEAKDCVDIDLLTKYALRVAGVFDGYWSVDFCQAKSGKWYLIDMAEGEKSWRPEVKEE